MPYAALHNSSRNPFEYGVVGGMSAFSVLQMATDKYPGLIYAFTTDAYRIAWGAFLLIGSLMALYGIVSKVHSRGLAFEAGGLYLMGGALLIYAFAVWIGPAGSAGWGSATSFTILGSCSILRAWYVHRGLRKIGRGEVRIVRLSDGSTAIVDTKTEDFK